MHNLKHSNIMKDSQNRGRKVSWQVKHLLINLKHLVRKCVKGKYERVHNISELTYWLDWLCGLDGAPQTELLYNKQLRDQIWNVLLMAPGCGYFVCSKESEFITKIKNWEVWSTMMVSLGHIEEHSVSVFTANFIICSIWHRRQVISMTYELGLN